MRRIREFIQRLHPYLLCWIATGLTIAQIVLVFVLPQPRSDAVRRIGIVLWWIGAFFGWYPILALRRAGRVPKGKSYVHTTALVETGIYAVVRHPQMGVAWLLMCTSLILMTQHWISVALGVPAMVLVYLDLLKADRRLTDKFGEAYQRYMDRVPRVDFVSGIIRLIRQQVS